MNTSSLAGHAIELVDIIVKSNSPADRIVADFYKERRYLGSHDRRWITEKVYSIIRNFILLKELSTSCAPHSGAFGVFIAHELQISDLKPDVIYQQFSNLISSYTLSGVEFDIDIFSRCIAERIDRIRNLKESEFTLRSFPEFFGKLLPDRIIHESLELMDSLNTEARFSIRVNTSRITRDKVIAELERAGIGATASLISPVGINLDKRVNLNTLQLFKSGMVEVQDESSQLVGFVVNPQPGELVVDACAGGGGKSLELADLSGGQARIYSLNVEPDRLSTLKSRSERDGFKNISAIRANRNSFDQIENLVSTADKVLVDAPCTGSGTIRRNPDKKFKLSESLVEKMSAYQCELIRHYAQLVRIGGVLVYSTCSIFELENRVVTAAFLESNSTFEQLDICDMRLEVDFSQLVHKGCIEIYPHRHDMDGFYIAVMRRVK